MAEVMLSFYIKTFRLIPRNFSNNAIANDISCFFLRPSIREKDVLSSAFSTSQDLYKQYKTIIKSDGSQTTKRVANSPRILLIDLSNNKKAMLLEDAEKLAKHLKVELIEDNFVGNLKSYRLVKIGDLVKSENKSNKQKWKTFVVKTSILKHDFQNKINQILKSLDKGFNSIVDVQVSTNAESLDSLVDQIINDIGSKHKTFEKKVMKKNVRINFIPSLERVMEQKEKLKKVGKVEKEEESKEDLYNEEKIKELLKK